MSELRRSIPEELTIGNFVANGAMLIVIADLGLAVQLLRKGVEVDGEGRRRRRRGTQLGNDNGDVVDWLPVNYRKCGNPYPAVMITRGGSRSILKPVTCHLVAPLCNKIHPRDTNAPKRKNFSSAIQLLHMGAHYKPKPNRDDRDDRPSLKYL